MRLIGNKAKLLGDIQSVLEAHKVERGTFIDIFTGTASVARHFKKLGFRVLANDLLSSCYTQAVAAVEVSDLPVLRRFLKTHADRILSDDFQKGFLAEEGLVWSRRQIAAAARGKRWKPDDPAREINLRLAVHFLNRCVPPRDGLIFRNFSPGGPQGRRYFREDHARKIDGILDLLRAHYHDGILEHAELHLLLSRVIDAADRRANISGTYGAYLKSWQSNTASDLHVEVPEVVESPIGHRVYQRDANELIRELEGDVLYIDPPYNHRQYAANYHVLEIIAEYHKVDDLAAYEMALYGKTGLRPYEDLRSDYCVPRSGRRRGRNVYEAMDDLLGNARVDHVLISYNQEGLLEKDELAELLAKFSDSKTFDFESHFREVEHQRFRSDRDRPEGDQSGKKRAYRVLEDRDRNRIGEWLLFASRKGSSRRKRRAGATVGTVDTVNSGRLDPGNGSSARGRAVKGKKREAPRYRSILVLANSKSPDGKKAATELASALRAYGSRVTRRLDGAAARRADLVILFGGDGFLMESIRKLEYTDVPILGVNFGNVGFLMNPRRCLEKLPEMILEGAFHTVEYPVLGADIKTPKGKSSTHYAFNDFVLERMTGQSIHFLAKVDGDPFNNFSGDGIIVATSGGSTAYNLAAGGPVVHPELPAMVITPLYPHRAAPFHSLDFSLLLPLSRTLTIDGQDVAKRPIRLFADGQRAADDVQTVVVRDSGKRIHLLRDQTETFSSTLARKFIGTLPE